MTRFQIFVRKAIEISRSLICAYAQQRVLNVDRRNKLALRMTKKKGHQSAKVFSAILRL